MLTQKRLGATSWTDIASGLTSGVAKDIVSQAEGPARKLIQRERHNFANGVISGLPFFGLGTMAYIGTRYFVPDDKKMELLKPFQPQLFTNDAEPVYLKPPA